MHDVGQKKTMIRLAKIEDADDVASLYIESRKRDVPYAPLAYSDDEIRDWMRTVLIPQGRVSVFMFQERIAAMIAVSETSDSAWIDQLYVHPDMTSRGYGTALMKEAISVLSRPIQLYTFQQNRRSRGFYERFGFIASQFSDGSQNEERCPDVLYRLEAERTTSFSSPELTNGF